MYHGRLAYNCYKYHVWAGPRQKSCCRWLAWLFADVIRFRKTVIETNIQAGLLQVDQPIWGLQAERTQEDAVDHAEDRRIGTDAERQRQRRDQCETGAPAQTAQRHEKIV